MTRTGIAAGGNWIIDHVKIIDTWPAPQTLANILAEQRGTGGAAYNVLVDLAVFGVGLELAGFGVDDVQQSLESAYLFPNPAKNKSSISIETDKSRMANIQLFNLNHKRIKDIFRGTISGQKTIEFSTDNLSAGIYLVGITIDSKHIFKKLIIY